MGCGESKHVKGEVGGSCRTTSINMWEGKTLLTKAFRPFTLHETLWRKEFYRREGAMAPILKLEGGTVDLLNDGE